MTSKKHWTLRAAGLLFALVLITSCFVGGTFAKYVTSKSASDIARVARFGVVIEAHDNTAFKTTYDTVDAGASVSFNSVATTTTDSLVAPGTGEDNAVTFSITGQPEVAVHVALSMTGTDVVLNAGTYPDLTTAAARDTFTLKNDYHPITYTLTKNGAATPVVKGNLNDIVDYLNKRSGNYPAKTDLTSEIGEYELSWEWKFEGGNDQADTLLGTLAASGPTGLGVDPTKYSPLVHLELAATVTQID